MIGALPPYRGPAAPASREEAGARPDPRVGEMAREFEALFLLQMLRQMRQAMALGDEPDPVTAPLTETIDEELSRALSRGGGIGIAATLAKAMNASAAAASAVPAEVGYHRLERPAATLAAATPKPPAPAPATVPDPHGRLPLAAAISTSPFGWRRDPFGGESRFHRGVDLRAAYGSEVATVAEGRVVLAGEQRGYGTTVVVEHADGLRTRYAHLSALAVRAGDEVVPGQVVGRAGQSGRATGPHLHFEVTRRGQPVDPGPFLPGVREASSALKDSGAVADSSYRDGSRQVPGALDED